MTLLKNILTYILPNQCVYCLQPNENILCNTCKTKLQKHKNQSNDTTIALFAYTNPVDKFILDLKFHKKLHYAKLLGELFAEHLQTLDNNQHPEAIIPMPLHPKRLRERGFNQAVELAKPIAKKLELPLLTNTCQRIRHTKAQSQVKARDRKQNVAGAFRVNSNIDWQHVAIIDDVITTGNTANALRQILQRHVSRVDVWCMARTSFNL